MSDLGFGLDCLREYNGPDTNPNDTIYVSRSDGLETLDCKSIEIDPTFVPCPDPDDPLRDTTGLLSDHNPTLLKMLVKAGSSVVKRPFLGWADFITDDGWTSQVVGDFNGDGLSDIANFHPDFGQWWVSRSNGSGFDF